MDGSGYVEGGVRGIAVHKIRNCCSRDSELLFTRFGIAVHAESELLFSLFFAPPANRQMTRGRGRSVDRQRQTEVSLFLSSTVSDACPTRRADRGI